MISSTSSGLMPTAAIGLRCESTMKAPCDSSESIVECRAFLTFVAPHPSAERFQHEKGEDCETSIFSPPAYIVASFAG